MKRKENKPITYHLEFYPTSAEADPSMLDSLLAKYAVKKKEDGYAVFTTDEIRPNIWKACESALKKDFFYVLAFEQDGGIYATIYPKHGRRRLLSMSDEEKSDLSIVLDSLGEVARTRAAVKRLPKK